LHRAVGPERNAKEEENHGFHQWGGLIPGGEPNFEAEVTRGGIVKDHRSPGSGRKEEPLGLFETTAVMATENGTLKNLLLRGKKKRKKGGERPKKRVSSREGGKGGLKERGTKGRCV